MKLQLREISTAELLIVYLCCLETPERLEKGQNGFLMMCGQGCQNIGILQVIGANVLQQKRIGLLKWMGPYTQVDPLPLTSMPFVWYTP